MAEHGIKTIFKCWGKADPNYPGELKWHSVVYHSLDVAAVGSQRKPMWVGDA